MTPSGYERPETLELDRRVRALVGYNRPLDDEPLKPVPSYTARSFGGPMSGRDIGSSSDAHRWVVWDIDFKTGKVRWQGTVLTGVPVEPKHQKNSYASETPATDGERVYVYSGNAGLFAFDMNGKPVWSKPMGPFKIRSAWDPAAAAA